MHDSKLPGFKIEDRTFSLTDVDVLIRRNVTGKPIEFVISSKFAGLSNLDVGAKFHLSPFDEFSAYVYYSHPPVNVNARRLRSGIYIINCFCIIL